MKILFVTDFYHPHIGGVEKLFKSLTEKLVNEGHHVTYITWLYDKKLSGKETINGVNIIRIPSISRALFSIIALPEIISQARKSDLIHTSTYSSAIGAMIASKITGKKIIITVHEVWGKLWLRLPYISKLTKIIFLLFERMLLRLKYDKYIAVSESTKAELLKHGIKIQKIELIYNGIEYDLPQWKEPDIPYTFTFFGRGGISKGLDLLTEAAQQVLLKNNNVRFKFIISPQIGNVFKKIIKTIQSGKLKEASQILSNLPYPQLKKELLLSNCIVIPSYSEGFGFTAVEASSMKIPIISSGQGALNEVVSGKVITMKTFNVQSLVQSMEDALNGKFDTIPEKIFTIENFVNKHIVLYEKIIG